MDPDENLSQQLRLSADISEHTEEKGEELAERVLSLDVWIRGGGFLPRKWAHSCHGGLLERALLAQEVYEKMYDTTVSFEAIGEQLSYLLGSILRGGDAVIALTSVAKEGEFLGMLHDAFDDDHAVWTYVHLAD